SSASFKAALRIRRKTTPPETQRKSLTSMANSDPRFIPLTKSRSVPCTATWWSKTASRHSLLDYRPSGIYLFSRTSLSQALLKRRPNPHMAQNAAYYRRLSVQLPIMPLAVNIVAHKPPQTCTRDHVSRKMTPCAHSRDHHRRCQPVCHYLHQRLRVL